MWYTARMTFNWPQGKWFAWFPVRLDSGEVACLCWVTRYDPMGMAPWVGGAEYRYKKYEQNDQV